MAEGDRPNDNVPPRKRRRKPPVLELAAKEVGSAGDQAGPERPRQEQQHHVGSEGWKQWRDSLAAVEWRGLASNPVVAASVGLLLGAFIVYALVVPRIVPGDPQAAALKNEIANLAARVELLAARPQTGAPDTGALGARIDRLTMAIGEADKRLGAMEQRPLPQAPDLSNVNQRTAAIESAVKDLRAALADLRKLAEQAPPAASLAAVESLASRIGGLEQRIASLAAARTATTGASIAAEVLALNALADAIRAGRPFVRELETARARLRGRAAPLAVLDAHAERGLPTIAALAERFAAVVPEMLRGPEPAGGFLSRLYTNAVRLVEIRPVGEPAGSGVGAIAARMETKLARGDLAGAIAESEALPETAKSAVATWLVAARQRHEADAAVKQMIDGVLATTAERDRP
jgi:hypothetical protein